ncbi:hypothetical protein BH20ACT4_BH20ACT4_05700 [soil metagenome]
MSRRAVAYIDGHNFYHGCVRDRPALKWLDLFGFCDALLGRHGVLERVKYYTARVVDFPSDPHQSQRQDVYLQALAADSRIEVVEGRFARRKKRVRLTSSGSTAMAEVWEEKGTDVNLAVDLTHDAAAGSTDVALVVSNDSDLQRAVDRARSYGVEVVAANPHHRTTPRPSLATDLNLSIRLWHLRDRQLADEVSLPSGAVVRRPVEWS